MACRMIETNMLPISVVPCEGFKELVRYFEPKYIMPPRHIENHFEDKKDGLKVKLDLTTDCRTALTKESMIATTRHFINAVCAAHSELLCPAHVTQISPRPRLKGKRRLHFTSSCVFS